MDQGNYSKGTTFPEAINNSLILARTAEELGYHRYWFAEHHNIPGLACSAPEIMITQIASQTKRLRVGSGGVLIRYYSPLRIAENFKTLETLFPGRIDLGVGRGTGDGNRETIIALHDGTLQDMKQRYSEKLNELMGFLQESFPNEHPYHKVNAFPQTSTIPEFWLLGSSEIGAINAAELGVPFSYGLFFDVKDGPKNVQTYRDNFKPSALLDKPKVMLGVFVICAETQEEAARIASSYELGMLLVMTGEPIPEVPIEEALNYPYTEKDLEIIENIRKTMIVGTPEFVKDRLFALNDEYGGVDEFIILTICYDFKDRIRSYELLSEVFELRYSLVL